MIPAGAAQAGRRILFSEDMQDGFTWRGAARAAAEATAPRRRSGGSPGAVSRRVRPSVRIEEPTLCPLPRSRRR